MSDDEKNNDEKPKMRPIRFGPPNAELERRRAQREKELGPPISKNLARAQKAREQK